MGKYVGSWIFAVCNIGFVACNFCRRFSDKVSLCVDVVLIELHTTLGALDLVAFLVWAVFGLLFECGKRDYATHCALLLC